jgi:hypothetical protein
MLALSEDPVERGTMYSYLTSAGEVDSTGKTFAERRRLAAEELFKGYQEVLAQELPVKAPERPPLGPVGERDDEDPNKRGQARAREFAMLEAYKQAVFIEDLVHRRETFLLQFRWLYRPQLKVHGRNAQSLDELRALASNKLKDAAAVEALLASVVGPEGIGRPSDKGEPKWEVTGVAEDLVQIGVGGKQGISVGDVVLINRSNQKSERIGKVRVLAIDHNEATGRLVEVAEPKVQVGDAISRAKLP